MRGKSAAAAAAAEEQQDDEDDPDPVVVVEYVAQAVVHRNLRMERIWREEIGGEFRLPFIVCRISRLHYQNMSKRPECAWISKIFLPRNGSIAVERF